MSIVVAQAKKSTEAPRALESRQHHERVLGGSRREGELVEVAEGATCRIGRCTSAGSAIEE